MGGLTLFEIDRNIREIIEQHTDEHGALSDEGDRELDALFEKREAKLLAYGCVIKEVRAEAAAVKEEAKKMRERAGTIGNRAEDLRDRLAEALGEGNKLKDHRVSLYWNTSERVVIDKPDAVPWELRKVIDSPDLEAIKAVLKGDDAASLEGIAHIEVKRSLVIR